MVTSSAMPVGDIDALARRYRAALVRFFSKRLRNDADAEDLAQEVLIRIARQGGPQHIDKLEGYLFRIASNLLCDRSRRGHARQVDAHISFEGSGFEGEVASEERVLEGRQAFEGFLAVLAEMSPRRRMVFTMHRFMGLSYGAIAVRLGISVGVVEKHMMKALLQFHTRLGPL